MMIDMTSCRVRCLRHLTKYSGKKLFVKTFIIVYLVYLCAVVGSTGLHLADLTKLRGDQETRLELEQLGGTSWWRPNLWQVCNINMDKGQTR